MSNNVVQLFSSHNLGPMASSYHAVIRPVVIMSAVTAISALGTSSNKLNDFDSDLCEQLSDTDWNDLPLKNNFESFKDKIFSFELQCKAVQEKLISEFTKDGKDIASNMGYLDRLPVRVVVTADSSRARANLDGVQISTYDLAKWWNLKTSPQRKQMRGVLAHEIAHRILRHSEKMIEKAFNTLGITIKSLDDIKQVFSWMPHSPLRELVLQSDSARQLFADFAAQIQRNTSTFQSVMVNVVNEWSFMINQEIEADLLTLRVPECARGLRDYFEECLLECEKAHNSTYCDGPDFTGSQHPPYRQRVTYMTDGLCEKYPGLNPDIFECSSSDIS